MPEEPTIPMSEFKVVMESMESKLRTITEGIGDIRIQMKNEFNTVKEQIALLHEGQTEIKYSLKEKVNRDEFSKLEMRVARLENKVA